MAYYSNKSVFGRPVFRCRFYLFLQSMFWHHGANVLFAGTVESELWMWKIPTGDSKIFTAHGEKIECAKILPDGRMSYFNTCHPFLQNSLL